ncbi:hypothetical protein [Paenibacillus validus]|uniref:hypothetical protein n=1 Tax=Paenibacillus validus TaxID=44253 RepID=UPI003D2BE723
MGLDFGLPTFNIGALQSMMMPLIIFFAAFSLLVKLGLKIIEMLFGKVAVYLLGAIGFMIVVSFGSALKSKVGIFSGGGFGGSIPGIADITSIFDQINSLANY